MEIDCFERRIGLLRFHAKSGQPLNFPSSSLSRTRPDAASVPIRIASANVPSSLIKPAMAKNNFEFNNLTNLRKPGNVIISNCFYNRLQQEE